MGELKGKRNEAVKAEFWCTTCERRTGGHLITAKIMSAHLAIEAIRLLIVFHLGLLSISCPSHRVPVSFLTCQGHSSKGVNC